MNARSKSLEVVAAALRNVLVGSNSLSLRLLGDPKRMAGYAAETWFLYRTYTGRRRVPQKTVFEVLGTANSPAVTTDVKLAWVPPQAGQWFQPLASYTVDLIALCSICTIAKPKVIFEIGTLAGYTALHFALNTSPDSQIYTLDLPVSQDEVPVLRTTFMDDAHIRAHTTVRQYVFEGFAESTKINTLFGDSARFDYAPFESRVDFFFIDGAHSYEYVRQDTVNALSCCHSGSVIAWHDYGRSGVNGVSKLIHELAHEYEVYAVPGGSVAFTVVR